MFTVFFESTPELTDEEQALYHAENLDEAFSDAAIRYVIVNIERCPTTQRVHWQGYMELTRPMRFTTIQQLIPILGTAHFEPRFGTQDEAVSYCSKTETRIDGVNRPYVYGQRAPGQGYRSDLESLTEALVSGKSQREIAEDMPGMFLRYHNGISAWMAAMSGGVEPVTDFVPRPWQADLLEKLAQPADDRTIFWVTDAQGGKGKTRLAGYLISNHSAIELGGKTADMVYAFVQQPAPIVVFDITRAAQELTGHIYTMAEKLKSGRLFNTKYHSRQVTFPPPHVVIFSNQSWDRTKFSLDRVKEIIL